MTNIRAISAFENVASTVVRAIDNGYISLQYRFLSIFSDYFLAIRFDHDRFDLLFR